MAERRAAVNGGALLELAREARPHVVRADRSTEEWLTRLDANREAFRLLIEDLVVTDPPSASEVAACIWPLWWLRGHMDEGRQLLERAAAIVSDDQVEVLKGLGTIAFRQGDLEVAERSFQSRLRLVEAGDDRAAVADAFADLARIALRRGDFAEVRRYAELGYDAASGLDQAAIRMPLHMRAAAARMEGRLDEARALYLESRELNESLGNEVNVAGEDHNLVYVALHAGDLDEARRRFRMSSEWIFAHDNAYLRPYAFLDAGILAFHSNDPDRACQLTARASRIFHDTDSIPDPDDRVELDNIIVRIREELGERFANIWAQGEALTDTQAQALTNM